MRISILITVAAAALALSASFTLFLPQPVALAQDKPAERKFLIAVYQDDSAEAASAWQKAHQSDFPNARTVRREDLRLPASFQRHVVLLSLDPVPETEALSLAIRFRADRLEPALIEVKISQ